MIQRHWCARRRSPPRSSRPRAARRRSCAPTADTPPSSGTCRRRPARRPSCSTRTTTYSHRDPIRSGPRHRSRRRSVATVCTAAAPRTTRPACSPMPRRCARSRESRPSAWRSSSKARRRRGPSTCADTSRASASDCGAMRSSSRTAGTGASAPPRSPRRCAAWSPAWSSCASLHDEQGRPRVPGLVQGKAPALDLTEDELRQQAGVLRGTKLIGEGGLTDRMWMMPAIAVLAIDAPPVREAVNQLVPVARAKVSMRIPPGQDATKALDALVAHLERNVPWGAELRIDRHPVGEPFATKTGGHAYKAMHAALAEAWGRPAVDTGTGGSIPFLFDFAELFPKAEILVTGVDDPESGPHGPDEGLHLAEFERVCLAEALFLAKLAAR